MVSAAFVENAIFSLLNYVSIFVKKKKNQLTLRVLLCFRLESK